MTLPAKKPASASTRTDPVSGLSVRFLKEHDIVRDVEPSQRLDVFVNVGYVRLPNGEIVRVTT